MATNVRDGLSKIRTIKYSHSSATTVNIIYYLAGMLMLAINTALANIENVFMISGLIEYAKLSAQAWTAGQKVYWDDGNSRFTTVAAGNTLAGIAAEDAANPSATGYILLMPEMRAASNPSDSIVFAGTTTAEDDQDESVVKTLTGLLATDIVTASILAQAGTASILKVVPTTDTLTITLSDNGGAGTQIAYQVSRPVI